MCKGYSKPKIKFLKERLVIGYAGACMYDPVFVAQGTSNREVSQQLFVSEHTVKIHLRIILNKLNLRNRQQAAAYAAKQELVREIALEDQP